MHARHHCQTLQAWRQRAKGRWRGRSWDEVPGDQKRSRREIEGGCRPANAEAAHNEADERENDHSPLHPEACGSLKPIGVVVGRVLARLWVRD